MAKIHKQSQDSAAELASSHLRKWNKVFYWEPLRITSEVKHLPAEDQRIFEQMTQRVSEALSTLWQGASPIRIHGDLHPNNVKVHKKQLVAFDFDDAMWGFPIQDIAIALTYLRHNPRFPAFLDAFRQGYTKHAQWPEAHPGHLETFFMGRLLWMANAVLDNENAGSEKDDDEESFKDRLARYIDEFKTVLEN